jgi:hypothetical protein
MSIDFMLVKTFNITNHKVHLLPSTHPPDTPPRSSATIRGNGKNATPHSEFTFSQGCQTPCSLVGDIYNRPVQPASVTFVSTRCFKISLLEAIRKKNRTGPREPAVRRRRPDNSCWNIGVRAWPWPRRQRFCYHSSGMYISCSIRVLFWRYREYAGWQQSVGGGGGGAV